MAVHLDQELVFFSSPLSPHDAGVEHIVPSLPALAPKSPWKKLCNDNPVLGAKLMNLLSEELVLLRRPLVADQDVMWDLLHLLHLRFAHGCRESSRQMWMIDLHCIFVDFFQIEPSFEATNLSLVWHELTQPMPRILAVDLL